MAPKKPNRMATLKEAFEQEDAKSDKKKGIKENSPEDEKLDAKEYPAFLKKKKGGK